MSGPGVYVPDVTEGITRVEDLPQPRIKLAAATSPAGAALSVGGAVAAGVWPPAPFMISATPSAADRSTCIFATPHIAVWPVVTPSLPISPTSPRSRASTPTGYNRRPCDW